jgi:hypothetical protein
MTGSILIGKFPRRNSAISGARKNKPNAGRMPLLAPGVAEFAIKSLEGGVYQAIPGIFQEIEGAHYGAVTVSLRI